MAISQIPAASAISGTLPVANGGTGTTNGPAFSAYAASVQSVSNSTQTKVAIDTKEFDTATCFNTSNNRFTPNVAGYYLVTGQVFYGSSTVSRMIVNIYKNGSSVKIGSDIVTSGYRVVASALVYMNGTTDYLELYTYCVGSGQTIGGSGSYDTYFQAFLARAA
jgi:hypothetical protein